MKPFDYLFFKLYKLFVWSGDINLFQEFKAWLFSSILVWLNILTVIGIVERGRDRPLLNEYLIWIFYVGYFVFTYWYLFNSDRYAGVLARYESNNRKQNSYGSIMVGTYIIITIIGFLIC